MTWFFAFLVVAVMGVIAVVASGRGGSMAEAYDDRPDSRVQADGPLTPADLRGVRFSTAFRGYRMSEVDSLLDRLAAELDANRAELAGDAPADEPVVDEPVVAAPTVDDPSVADPSVDDPSTADPSALGKHAADDADTGRR